MHEIFKYLNIYWKPPKKQNSFTHVVKMGGGLSTFFSVCEPQKTVLIANNIQQNMLKLSLNIPHTLVRVDLI